MAEIRAKLNENGQLVSDAIKGTKPIVVKSTTMVDNLSAEYLNDLKKDSFLRTDGNSSLNSGKTLTVEGEINIDTGKLTMGGLELKVTDGILSIMVIEG